MQDQSRPVPSQQQCFPGALSVCLVLVRGAAFSAQQKWSARARCQSSVRHFPFQERRSVFSSRAPGRISPVFPIEGVDWAPSCADFLVPSSLYVLSRTQTCTPIVKTNRTILRPIEHTLFYFIFQISFVRCWFLDCILPSYFFEQLKIISLFLRTFSETSDNQTTLIGYPLGPLTNSFFVYVVFILYILF